MKHPIQEAWGCGSTPTEEAAAEDIPNAGEGYFVTTFASVNDITTRDLERTQLVLIRSSASVAIYRQDLNNVDAEDGETVVWDSEGRPFVRIAEISDMAQRISFAANKNGVNQTISSATFTKITFANEVFDNGGLYDAANSRFVAEEGTYVFISSLNFSTGLSDQSRYIAEIRRNGTLVHQRIEPQSGAASVSIEIAVLLACEDGDEIEVYGYAEGVGDKTVQGTVFTTYFQGVKVDGQKGEPGRDGGGYPYTYSTNTVAPPASGGIEFDNPDLSAAAVMRVHKTTRGGSNIGARLLALGDPAKTIKDSVTLTNLANLKQVSFNVNAVTDQSTYVDIAIAGHAGETAFDDATDLQLALEFAGADGADGNDGADGADGTDPGILLTWDDGNAGAGIGDGEIRADDDDLSLATELYISKVNRAGDAIDARLLALASSTNPGVKADLTITSSGGNAQAFFELTAASDGGDHIVFSVGGHDGATGFVDGVAVSLQAERVGDKGNDGVDGDLTLSSLFATVDPEPGSEAAGDLMFDAQNGAQTYFEHTLAANAELQAIANAPVGSTIEVLLNPNGNSLTFDTAAYEGPDDALPDISGETLIVIKVATGPRFLVHVAGQGYGNGL